VARCEELEAILQAQLELEFAEPAEWPERMRRLNFLVDQMIAGTTLTRLDLLTALRDRYKAYKRAQLLAQARRRSV
jgi:hypothetical protein